MRRRILRTHQTQIQRSTIAHLVIGVIETAGKENLYTRLDFGVFLANAKFGQSSDSGGTHNGVLQNDTVVDVADVLGRVVGLGALDTEQMQDPDRQLRELTVLNELTKMSQSYSTFVRQYTWNERKNRFGAYLLPCFREQT